MFTKRFLFTIFLALTVAASPVVLHKSPVSLPLSRKINAAGGTRNIVALDQARAAALKSRVSGQKSSGSPSASSVNQPIDNRVVSYFASVDVGSPGTTYELLIDTGSSNTWVGAKKPYSETSTSRKTEDSVSVTYGSGSFSGTEYIDQVSLGDGLVISDQSIGVASKSTGFGGGEDGILGIGPVDLTIGTLSPHTHSEIPTVTDNLFQTGAISENSIGIYFEPANVNENPDGVLTWGGVDSSKTKGEVTYIPITERSPASKYWGIDQSIRYGSQTILPTTAGIVDTGTTLILLATDAFNAYQSATGATPDSATGLLTISRSQYSQLKSLFFEAGGQSFEFVPNAQIWPRSLNKDIGGDSDKIYLIVADIGTPSGQGLDFINGYTFLERYYSVYDTGNSRVGFAATRFTELNVN